MPAVNNVYLQDRLSLATSSVALKLCQQYPMYSHDSVAKQLVSCYQYCCERVCFSPPSDQPPVLAMVAVSMAAPHTIAAMAVMGTEVPLLLRDSAGSATLETHASWTLQYRWMAVAVNTQHSPVGCSFWTVHLSSWSHVRNLVTFSWRKRAENNHHAKNVSGNTSFQLHNEV